MTKDSTKGTIEYIRTLQHDLMQEEEILGNAMPFHCDEAIFAMEKHMEKVIANLIKQLQETMMFLETEAEISIARKMQADLENILETIKKLKHADSQFKGDHREDPLGKFLHFHDVPSRSFYAIINDYITVKGYVANFINAKLNEQEQAKQDLK